MASSSTEMAIFQRVAERGSFAGAAEDAGLSPSAVAKLITRLATPRCASHQSHDPAAGTDRRGGIYLDRVHEILAAIEAAESEIVSAHASPSRTPVLSHARSSISPGSFAQVQAISPVMGGRPNLAISFVTHA